ncbi:MAG TPA: hypothetical protein VFJ06_03700 [Halococcus sp.]|nr:hypothetical protein [Halococcus sp.]
MTAETEKRLKCGDREHPDGETMIPYSLKGPDNDREICENPATFRVGDAKRVIVERETIDLNTLEPTTLREEKTQGTVLTCAVHAERAKEQWRSREQVDPSDYPTIEKLNQGQ